MLSLLNNIINSANKSNVDQINAFGNTLSSWRKEIINSFYIFEEIIDQDGVVTYRKMNNGIAENKNRTLKLIKNHSHGYRSW